MTTFFHSLGPAWRPLVQLAAAYAAAAAVTATACMFDLASDEVRWVFVGAGAPP